MTPAGRGDLAGLLQDVERGDFPPADMGLTVLPSERDTVVLGFTAHTVVAGDVSAEWLEATLPRDDPGAAFNPPFLRALELHVGRRVNNIDLLTLAPPRAGEPELPLRRIQDLTHPRVIRALRYRSEVTVWTVEGGVLVIGRGVAGRWEVAVEVDRAYRGKGLGRAMVTAARHLAAEDRPMWAQIAVGNTASLRAFLAAGYLPVGEEALLV